MYRGETEVSFILRKHTVKKDPSRAKQNSLATAGTNLAKPGAQNQGDLCMKLHFLYCG